jgi:hypothetical protein
MTDLLVSIDSASVQFPTGVRSVIAANLADITQVEGAAVFEATGRVHTVDPSMSQTAIQSVMNGLSAGSTIIFAPGTYVLAGALTAPAVDDVIVSALGATFQQTTWGAPGFDLMGANGWTLDIDLVQFTGTRGSMGSSVRGSAQYVSTAGVWANGDRIHVRNLRTSGMVCGVFFSSWNGTSTYDRYGLNNRIGRLHVESYNFGVLWVGQNNLTIDDISGYGNLDDSGGTNPNHLYYGSATTTFRSTNVTIRRAYAENNLNGQAFQNKYSDRFMVREHAAYNCAGLFNLIDCHDLDVDGVSGSSILANSGQGAFTMQMTNLNSQRPNVRNVTVRLAANVDEQGFMAISDDGRFDNVAVESNHSSGAASTITDVNVRGSRNRFRDTQVRDLGAGHVTAIGVGSGTPTTANNTVIDSPDIAGSAYGVNIVGGSTGVVIDYDPTLQALSSTNSFITSSGGTGAEQWLTRSRAARALSTFGENPVVNTLIAGTPTVGAANSALQVRIRPTRTITVSGLKWWSVTQSGNYDIGIIDDTTNTTLWSKGSTAWPVAGVVTETPSAVVLRAGHDYRLVFAADNGTGTLRGATTAVSGMDVALDGSTLSTTVSAAFPIPSTLVAGSSGSTARTPLIVVLGS